MTDKWADFRQAILNNERLKGLPAYKELKDLAGMHGISMPYAYKMRSQLIREGKLRPEIIRTRSDRKGAKAVGAYLPIGSLAEFRKELEKELPMTKDEWIRVLSHLVRTGAPAMKISAIKALEDLTRSSERQVGPPPPMTHAERRERMARLMRAVGPELTDEAREDAFGRTPEGGVLAGTPAPPEGPQPGPVQ
jgi:hypothetical protein